MGKEERNMELLEQHAMGSVEFDVLKVALESSDEHSNAEESIELFNVAMQTLEIAFWRDELKKIANEI